MQISVSQHIYSNVPKEQSPNNRRGYQTLFYTKNDLTKEEIFVLEDHAQYYAGEDEPSKYQFHMLPTGKAVVTKVVPLAEPDEFGRKGRYLSHSLILSPSSFRSLDSCPLELFSPKSFVTDLETAYRMADKTTGDISAETRTLADNWHDMALEASRQWSTQNLEKLCRLAWQARTLREEGKAVAIEGTIQELFQMFAVTFLLTEPSKRPFLTFDTHVLGCDWTRERPFWAWGGLEENQKADFFIDAHTKQVQANLDPQLDSPYERWIVQNVIPSKLEYFLAEQQDALKLNTILQGNKTDVSEVDLRFGQNFAQINAGFVAREIIVYFPVELSAATKKHIITDVRSEPWPYLERLGLGIEKQDVAEMMYSLEIETIRTAFPEEDRKPLEQLAEETNHEELASIILLRRGDVSAWQKSLPNLSRDAYYNLVRNAASVRVISVGDAFSAEHFDTWCNIARKNLKPGDLEAVLKKLKKYKKPFDAEQFTILLPYLSAGDKQTLTKWVQSYKGDAPRLRAELKVDEIESPSLVNKLKSILPGQSSKPKRKKR